LETVARRTPTKINSFKYFIKEITAQPDPRNRAWQKKRLEKIVHKIRDISVGRGGYSMADFVEDVKCNCAREGIAFDNDVFNELLLTSKRFPLGEGQQLAANTVFFYEDKLSILVIP
jgi:hypothetical protein